MTEEIRGTKRGAVDYDLSGATKRAECEAVVPQFTCSPDDQWVMGITQQDANAESSRDLSPATSYYGVVGSVLDSSIASGTQWGTPAVDSSPPLEETGFCCGMVDKVSCRLLKDAPILERGKHEEHLLTEKYVRLTLQRQNDRYQLSLGPRTPIATLNNHVAGALSELETLSSVGFTPYADREQIVSCLSFSTSVQQRHQIIPISINVHGGNSDLQSIGTVLSEKGIYLQDPNWMDPAVPYCNPHVVKFDEISDADIWLEELSLTFANNRENETSEIEDWTLVLDHLPQYHAPAAVTDLSLLQVPLLDHQLDGLNFMLKRETGDLDETLRYWHVADDGDDGDGVMYKHAVTRDECAGPPTEPKGGILADDMGLGKTLTTLAVVTSSLSRAAIFASSPLQSVSRQEIWARSKATLVVLPHELITKQWIDEIEAKLKPSSIAYTVYHGQHRARHFSELLNYDVVFTTYGTIAKEHVRTKAREILYRIEWFRVVLDEAHVIRSQRTRQFTSIVSLQAKHHWCLTGTPISNKVDDLGALVTFCRVPLLEDHVHFREHVIKATRRSFRAGCGAIQRTLAPLCLRRTKNLLNLPEPIQTTIAVKFSDSESQHYRNVMKQCRIALDAAVSGHQKLKHTMLQSILQLRLFCNQGTFTTFARPCAEDALDPDEALALLQQNDNAKCSSCSQEVLVINQAPDGECGVLPTCLHVLCRLCFHSANADDVGAFICPKCMLSVQQTQLQPWQQLADSNSQPEHHSSKLEKLLEDLSETENVEKSLVLSYWKKTIDLAAALCAARGINFVRVDGTMSQPERKAALNSFMADKDVSTLLMTMGTGALGLNLTVATRIHLLEPQWNPSVEDQAIGRLVRIGQQKNVRVLRYIVQGSIEEQIQIYQKRKIQLIAGGFGDSSDAAVEVQTRVLTATFFAEGKRSDNVGPQLTTGDV